MAFSDIIKKLMSDKEESDDTLPSDETSISIQNEIENKSESINSGITEIHISILRIFDSIYSVNKMSKDLNSLEKYTQKKPKKSVSRKDKVDLIPEFKASKILLFAALAVALDMLLEWITNFITGTVNTITDAINGIVNIFYDFEQNINSFVSGSERSFISGIVSSTNTILGLAYDLASSALSAYYGTLTVFSSSEKKEQVQQEIQRFKTEGVEKKKQVTLFGVTQTAAITASEETRKQEIEVSRVESIASVNAKGQEVITAITPPRLFDIFGTSKPAQSFGGGGATGNISTEPYTGQPLKDRTVGTAEMTNANEVISFFQRKGFTKEQSIGIAANIYKESSFNPNSINEAGGNLGAYGLAQWRGDRQGKNYAKWAKTTGRNTNMRQSSKEDQLEYINYELTEGAYTLVGSDLKRVKTIEDATKLIFDRYEVVGDNTLPSRIQTAKAYYNRGSPPIIIATTNTPPPKAPQPPRIKTKIVVDNRDVHGIKDRHPPTDNHNHT